MQDRYLCTPGAPTYAGVACLRMALDAAPRVHDAELVRLDELHAHPSNYRSHPQPQLAHLAQSMREHGVYRNVVIASDGTILAGHGVVEAAREAGLDHIAAVRLDLAPDDPKARKLLAADNELSRLADDDVDALAALLTEIRDDDVDGLFGTGYSDADLSMLLGTLIDDGPVGEIDVDDEDAPLPGSYTFDVFDREQVIESAFAYYRESGFPYRSPPLFVCMNEINRLAATADDALERSRIGYASADRFHPHRWGVKVEGKRTPLEIFASDKYLRVAIEHTIDYRMSLAPTSFASSLSLTRNGQVASNFRPGFALMLLRRYAPDGATVFDSSTGFGGRLVGFFASRCSTYVGIDPATETYAGNLQLVDALCPADKLVELHCAAAEDVPHDVVADRCDVALTSPPYFAKEMYADEDTQSFKRYTDGESWRDGFLLPMLALQHAALKPGGVNLLNIADVKIKSKEYPLVDWALAAGREVGFEIVEIQRYALSQHFGRGVDEREGEDGVASEPVIVMRKPTS